MKKRVVSLFLMAGIVFCSCAVIVKGAVEFNKASTVGNSSVKKVDLEKRLIADPTNFEPEVALKAKV